MAKAALLNTIEVVSQEVEALGLAKTATALWRIVEKRNDLQGGRICQLGNTSEIHIPSTL